MFASILLSVWISASALITGIGWTDCADYGIARVAIFSQAACGSGGESQTITKTGTISQSFDLIGSVFFNSPGNSLKLAENEDGSGGSTCVTETKWDIANDPWETGEGKMTEVRFIHFYPNEGCKKETMNPTWTDCADYDIAPVAIFSQAACNSTGESQVITQTGQISISVSTVGSVAFDSPGNSLKLAENPDGSGGTTCVTETKWDIANDPWETGEGKMTEVRFARLYQNEGCFEQLYLPLILN